MYYMTAAKVFLTQLVLGGGKSKDKVPNHLRTKSLLI